MVLQYYISLLSSFSQYQKYLCKIFSMWTYPPLPRMGRNLLASLKIWSIWLGNKFQNKFQNIKANYVISFCTIKYNLYSLFVCLLVSCFYLFVSCFFNIVRWAKDGSPTLVLPITGTINGVTQNGAWKKKKKKSDLSCAFKPCWNINCQRESKLMCTIK